MTTFNTESKTIDDKALELVTGGERTILENLHRLVFAVSCVLDGNKLTVKGDQLQCHS